MKITTKQRSGDWIAYMDGDPKRWESGQCEEMAIGMLIRNRSAEMGIVLERLDHKPKGLASPNGLRIGLRVRTVDLEGTAGMQIHHKHLNERAEGVAGTVAGWVPGHGGDVWFVDQGGAWVQAYCFNELQLLGDGE